MTDRDMLFIKAEDETVLGTLTQDGRWTGNRYLELDVRAAIRKHELDLYKEADRITLREVFGGSRLYAVEGQEFGSTAI